MYCKDADMVKDNIAEWTGEVPARFHTPFDTGSIPVSAIRPAFWFNRPVKQRVGFFYNLIFD